jgi:hypothetical protein
MVAAAEEWTAGIAVELLATDCTVAAVVERLLAVAYTAIDSAVEQLLPESIRH